MVTAPSRLLPVLLACCFLLTAVAPGVEGGLSTGQPSTHASPHKDRIVLPDGTVLKTPESQKAQKALAAAYPARVPSGLPGLYPGTNAASTAKLATLSSSIYRGSTSGPLGAALLANDDIRSCGVTTGLACAKWIASCDPTSDDGFDATDFTPDQQWNTPQPEAEPNGPPQNPACTVSRPSCDPSHPFTIDWTPPGTGWVPHREGGLPMVTPYQCDPCSHVSQPFGDGCQVECDQVVGYVGVTTSLDPCDACQPANSCVPDPCDGSVVIGGLTSAIDPCACVPVSSCIPDPCDGSVTIGGASAIDPCTCVPVGSCIPDPCDGSIWGSGAIDPCDPACQPISSCVPDPCGGSVVVGGLGSAIDPCDPPCQPAGSCVPDPCGDGAGIGVGGSSANTAIDPCRCQQVNACVPDVCDTGVRVPPCEPIGPVPDPCDRVTVPPCEPVGPLPDPCYDGRDLPVCRPPAAPEGAPGADGASFGVGDLGDPAGAVQPQSTAMSASSTTIRGTLMLPLPDGSRYPCSFCKVVLTDYDDWSADDYLGDATTDFDGTFSASVDNDDAHKGVDPYLNVFTVSRTAAGDVYDQVLDPESRMPYAVETHIITDDCPNGTCDLGTVNLDAVADSSPSQLDDGPTANDWAAFYILRAQSVTLAVDAAGAGFSTVPLTTYFPAEAVPAASSRPITSKYGAEWRPCDPVEEPDSMPPRPAPGAPDPAPYVCADPKHTVLVGSTYAYFGVTIAHELGHGLMAIAQGLAGTPAASLAAFDCTGLDHFFTGRSSAGCAYSEGFAHFHGGYTFMGGLAAPAPLAYILPHWNGACADPEAQEEVAACYTGEDAVAFSLETRACVPPFTCGATPNAGKRVEGNVAATFWDLVDTNADGTDTAAAITFAALMTVVQTHGAGYAHAGAPVDLLEFESAWTAAGHAGATLTSTETQSTTNVW